MGIWSKLKTVLGLAVAVAPVLPLPNKLKTVVSTIGRVDAAVKKHHKKRPVKPA